MDHFKTKALQWDTPLKIDENKKYAEKISQSLLKRNQKKITNVLEMGCGTGLLGSHFMHEHTHFLGVDTSHSMLAIFDQKFSEQKNVRSLYLNLEENNFPNGTPQFDLIISSMAFHHLKNPMAMVLKLKKNLAEGGVLAIIDLDAENGSFHPHPEEMGVYHFGFSNKETKSWGENAGFPNHSREIINTIKKDSGDYPIFLTTYFS